MGRTLIEALPYIRRFTTRRWSSNTAVTPWSTNTLKKSFALNVVMLKYIGINPVMVHGGGPQIGRC